MSTEIAPIVLPWFPAACRPNARSASHWPRTIAMKKTRHWGWMATVSALPGYKPTAGRISLQFTFYPPVARRHDDDNLISACKGFRDGIADALGVSDNLFDVLPVFIAEPVKGGKIVVKLG
jgi:crossover junction endodeoxyribonuclease RusA